MTWKQHERSPPPGPCATPADHLLAMKVRAARSARDADDNRLLLEALELDTIEEVTELMQRSFPHEPLSDRSRLLLEDLLAERHR